MQIKVIQVFRKYASVPKPLFGSGFRSKFAQWPKNTTSSTGFLRAEKLFLNESLQDKSFFNKGVVILVDTIDASPNIFAPEPFYYFGRYSQQKFDIFKITHIKPDLLELHTDFQDLSGFTSFPQMQNHQIGVLHPGKPIRYLTNNRLDNTASGFSKQRQFLVWDLTFEYIGDASSIDFLPLHKLSHQKSINSKDCREVDERKIIW